MKKSLMWCVVVAMGVLVDRCSAEDDAEVLLKAVREKTLKANSLRVGVTITPRESNMPGVVFSGEVRAKGSSQWLVDFVVKKRDGLEKRFRGSCDGMNVGMTGFRGKAGKAYEPERYSRQLRDWCATSFVPIFFSLMYGNIDQGDDNLPKVSGAKSLGWQKVGGVDARVVEYVLTYPTNSKVQVKAWIDPVKMLPLRREVGPPAGVIVETITSFELDPETPDSVFLTPDATKVDKVAVPSSQEKAPPQKQAAAEQPTAPQLTIVRSGPKPVFAVAPFDAEQARKHQAAWAKHLGVPVEWTNSIGMKLKLIPAGEFLMGSPESDASASSGEKPQHKVRITIPAGAFSLSDPEASHNGKPQHKVRITKPFYLGLYEVTQAEYEKVMGKNPSWYSKGGRWAKRVSGNDTSRYPVDNVNWEDAVEFCKKLSAQEGKNYRLPTEAEWEYACRAGTTTKWSCGDQEDELMRVAWYNPQRQHFLTHPVGAKEANAWGLFDMHGNVSEWCQDWYGRYDSGEAIDPTGPPQGKLRVYRGGSWESGAKGCMSLYRLGRTAPSFHFGYLGFRVALVPSASPDKSSK